MLRQSSGEVPSAFQPQWLANRATTAQVRLVRELHHDPGRRCAKVACSADRRARRRQQPSKPPHRRRLVQPGVVKSGHGLLNAGPTTRTRTPSGATSTALSAALGRRTSARRLRSGASQTGVISAHREDCLFTKQTVKAAAPLSLQVEAIRLEQQHSPGPRGLHTGCAASMN